MLIVAKVYCEFTSIAKHWYSSGKLNLLQIHCKFVTNSFCSGDVSSNEALIILHVFDTSIIISLNAQVNLTFHVQIWRHAVVECIPSTILFLCETYFTTKKFYVNKHSHFILRSNSLY